MKNIIDVIRIYESESTVADIENKIIENPATVDLMSAKESELNWKKISKLSTEQFENVFKGKTLMLYLPVTFIGNLADDSFVSKAKQKGSSRNGNFHFGWGDCTIVFITNINNGKCNIYDVTWNRRLSTHKHKQNQTWLSDSGEKDVDINKITASLKGLGLKAFNQGKYVPKIFVVDASNITEYSNKPEVLTIRKFFKPYTDIIDKHLKAYQDMIAEIKEIVKKCRYRDDVHDLRKGSTWNYVIFDDGDCDCGIVGYAKAMIFSRRYQEAPELSRPSSVSISSWGYDRYWGTRKVPCYKITSNIYDKIEKLVNERWSELEKMGKNSAEFMNKWINKFVLGETVDFGELYKKEEEKIEKEAEKKPETNNDPNSGSEKIKASKKALATAEQKMDLWHEGKRKQNLANCSDAKLKMNYQICKDKGYEKECSQIEIEAKKRGLSLTTSTNESLIDIAVDEINE